MSYPEFMANNAHSNGSETVYVVVDGKRVPLDYASARAVALNAHLLALGDLKRAYEMVAEAEREQITA